MQIEIQNPQTQTILFTIILLMIIFALIYKRNNNEALFPNKLTQELKGFAILTIIFGHIGYFLDSQDKFLYPLSIASGVGVNLFLFLSGYGLTKSSLKKALSILEFYKKRLLKLFIPMWIVLCILLLLDWSILGISYERKTIFQNLLGFFPVADIYSSINSVLWYFTFILFYYLTFPFFTLSKKILLLSPVFIYLISYYLLKQNLPINQDVLTLHRLHIFAFPLGMIAALVPEYLKQIPKMAKTLSLLIAKLKRTHWLINFMLLILFGWIFAYTAVNSGVGEGKNIEQLISNITMFAALFFFTLKRFSSKFLELLGLFSYEIYLLHWPLIYRYDFLYKHLPPFLATLLYIFILIALAWSLQKSVEWIAKKLRL